MTTTPVPDPSDFDGCARRCRQSGTHTHIWGDCALGVQPEPTVSMSRTFTASDGQPAIGFDTYTLQELADLIEPTLRAVAVRLGPNALAALHRGESVTLSGGEYADLARAAADAILHRNTQEGSR